MRLVLLCCLAPLASCAQDQGESAPTGIAALGHGTHSMDEVDTTILATADDGLDGPRDLDFNPAHPGELWIVSRHDDSVTIIADVGAASPSAQRVKDPYAFHFMEEVSSLSFGRAMKFATCHESRNSYDGHAVENDAMGPTLWSADLDVFAHSNPAAESQLGFDLGSHIDMLHESPLCMGIAWVDANVYFTFDGLAGSISRYDFVQDHGPGFDDHSDGVIQRFPEAKVERVAEVPSHLAYDSDTGLLYIADTGHSRIAVLDASTAAVARPLAAKEPGTTLLEMAGAGWSELVNGGDGYLELPSGVALHDGVVYVTDNANSRITAFSPEGDVLDWLDTGLPAGSLMGLRVDEQGVIFVVDYLGDQVLRIAART